MRPPSFADTWASEWCEWVLDHDLPGLPSTVGAGEAVPISRWIGEFAAVLLVSCVEAWDDDEGSGDGVRHDLDTYCFRRAEPGWLPANGTGGTAWPGGAGLKRLSVPDRHASITGATFLGGDSWHCVAFEYEAGRAAALVELTIDGRATTQGVSAPLGVGVVCAPWPSAVSVRILTATGAQLTKHTA